MQGSPRRPAPAPTAAGITSDRRGAACTNDLRATYSGVRSHPRPNAHLSDLRPIPAHLKYLPLDRLNQGGTAAAPPRGAPQLSASRRSKASVRSRSSASAARRLLFSRSARSSRARRVDTGVRGVGGSS